MYGTVQDREYENVNLKPMLYYSVGVFVLKRGGGQREVWDEMEALELVKKRICIYCRNIALRQP